MILFKGNPKPEVTFSKGGQEIKDGGRFTIACDGDEYSLSIKDATEADSGTYKITAKSSAGESSQEVQVKVAAKLAKPE